ncbi:Translational repressor [Malassezia sp. CBS 17886]|nr:Translational repressor [Malassezia sp. CBS 17886]
MSHSAENGGDTPPAWSGGGGRRAAGEAGAGGGAGVGHGGDSPQEQLLQTQLEHLGLGAGDAGAPPAARTPRGPFPEFLPRHQPAGADRAAAAWPAHTRWPSDALGAPAGPWDPPPAPPAPPLAPLYFHRRDSGETNNAFRFPSSHPRTAASEDAAPPGEGTAPFAAAHVSVEQQRYAIQQQIEQLQRQQLQLQRQQQFLRPGLPALQEGPEHRGGSARALAHRRIQSQSATSAFDAAPGGASSMRGADAALGTGAPGTGAPFAFPARRAERAAERAAGDTPAALPRNASHARHASYQLASELSPEFLIAGGGILSLASLGVGGTWSDYTADGFGELGGAPGGVPPGDGAAERGTLGLGPPPRARPGAGHNRSSSMSSAAWRAAPAASSASMSEEMLANLSQAQAQLLALHRSRQQAGPGAHTRSTSYSGGRSVSQGSTAPRKALFGSYLPQSSLPPLLLTGKLVVGILRVNKRNRSDAWVTTEVLDSDIFISGSKDRNRALEGDLVAVELLDPHEVWQTKRDKVDKKKRKEEGAHGGAAVLQKPVAGRHPDKARDDVEVEGAQLKLIEDEEESESSPPALAGHVVAIVERMPGQIFPGTLALLRPSSAATKEKQQAERGGADEAGADAPAPRPKIVWFRPTDKRVPLIAIPADQAPADFWTDTHDRYARCLFVACIKRWPITSLHPFGALVDRLGPVGELRAETHAVLRSHCNSQAAEFPDAALRGVPPAPWSVPPAEHEARRAFGGAGAADGTAVFAVRTAAGAPVERALSVQPLAQDAVAIGVHVADVSYFVRPGSALDREAKKRGAAVFIAEERGELFPASLAHVCALDVGVDRLALSVVFTVDAADRVVDVWIGRSVLHTQAHLSHAELQSVLHGDADALPTVPLPAAPLQRAATVALKMRAARRADGAMLLPHPRLVFALDAHGAPTDVHVDDGTAHHDARVLVDELGTHADTAVAHRVAAAWPDTALLLRQDAPHERALHTLRTKLHALGVRTDTLTAATLPAIVESVRDPAAREAVDALVRTALEPAKLYCTGMVDMSKFAYYTLRAPVYAHYTAPLLRYADLCVHRQLLAALVPDASAPPLDRDAAAKIAQQCNVKQRAVEHTEEQGSHLFLCQLLRTWTETQGPVARDALVMAVCESSFDIVVPSLAVEKRMHLDCLPLEATQLDAASATLTLVWRRGVHTVEWLAHSMDDAHSQRLWARMAHRGDAGHPPRSGPAKQTIAPLTRLTVHVAADMEKSPPVLKILPANPFA